MSRGCRYVSIVLILSWIIPELYQRMIRLLFSIVRPMRGAPGDSITSSIIEYCRIDIPVCLKSIETSVPKLE